jgi:hypothetical protein
MIGWIVQATTLSLCLIAVLHYLYVFFKTTLTVPKVKDLVNRPQKQYDAIFNTMGAGGTNHAAAVVRGGGGSGSGTARGSTTDISTLPILGVSGGSSGSSSSSSSGQRNPWENRESASVSMKQELKHFLKELNSNNNR